MGTQCSGPSAQVCTLDPSDTGQPGSCPHSVGPTASLPEALMGFLALSPRVPLCPDHALPQGPSSNVLPFLCDTDAFKFRSNTIFGTLGSLSAAPFLWPDQISSGGGGPSSWLPRSLAPGPRESQKISAEIQGMTPA